MVINEIEFKGICDFCKKEGLKETAYNVDQDVHTLAFLNPEEKWICNSCLKYKMLRVHSTLDN